MTISEIYLDFLKKFQVVNMKLLVSDDQILKKTDFKIILSLLEANDQERC